MKVKIYVMYMNYKCIYDSLITNREHFGLAYQFKRFPQYNSISNGYKQFTKEKAIELLNSIA